MAFTFSFNNNFSFSVSFDTDALTYITAVETADGQALESTTKTAINNFVVECKAKGIWNAIKASCILAGARTLSGALVPLVGTAPTNVNFVSGDYNRKTGLLGDGTTKWINTNRLDTADPINAFHISVYPTGLVTGSGKFVAGAGFAALGSTTMEADTRARCRSSVISGTTQTRTSSFMGISRASSLNYVGRYNGTSTTITDTSLGTVGLTWGIFCSNNSGSPALPFAERIAFYSIGDPLTLATLETAVTNLMTAISAAF